MWRKNFVALQESCIQPETLVLSLIWFHLKPGWVIADAGETRPWMRPPSFQKPHALSASILRCWYMTGSSAQPFLTWLLGNTGPGQPQPSQPNGYPVITGQSPCSNLNDCMICSQSGFSVILSLKVLMVAWSRPYQGDKVSCCQASLLNSSSQDHQGGASGWSCPDNGLKAPPLPQRAICRMCSHKDTLPATH